MVLLSIAFLYLLFVSQIQSQYQYATWMENMSTTNAIAIFGVNLYQKRLFDIILPGAHLAGMNFVNFSNKHIPDNGNSNQILSLNEQQQILWSERQRLSIYKQLMYGARFIDLQLKYEPITNKYYCYNILLGQPLLQILDQIVDFTLNIGTKEIIVIYLHDFKSTNSRDSELANLFDSIIGHSIISKVADSAIYNILEVTMQDFIDNNINIIIFIDEYPTNINFDKKKLKYFYNGYEYIDKNDYDVNEQLINSSDIGSQRISFILSDLSKGWNTNQLKLIYWTLDISDTYAETYVFDSYYSYNNLIRKELNSTLSSYNKLHFGNVIIIDFFQSTDIMEQILILNYKYFQCSDLLIGNDNESCAVLTNLEINYNSNDISIECKENYLQQNCKRSCGKCANITGNPGDICHTNNDCINILNKLYSNDGQCFISDNYDTKSFCLIPNAMESCGIYNNDSICYLSKDCEAYKCIADYQCQSGYCDEKYSVCTNRNYYDYNGDNHNITQRYKRIESTKAALYLNGLKPLGYSNNITSFKTINCEDIHNTFECIISNTKNNEYIACIFDLMLIPLIASLILFIIYCCTWPWFCFCEELPKRICCVKCIGNPDNKRICHWSIFAMICIVNIGILLAAISGIIYNAKLHNHSWGEQHTVSMDLFAEMKKTVVKLDPSVHILTNNVNKYMINVETLSHKTNIINNDSIILLQKLQNMKTYYTKKELNIMAYNPFNDEYINFNMDCNSCSNISYNMQSIGDIFNLTMLHILIEFNTILNNTSNFTDIITPIQNRVNDLSNAIHFYANLSINMEYG
eukprot:321574_1